MKHATTPCPDCGHPVVLVHVGLAAVRLCPTTRVYVRIPPHGEDEAAYWIEDQAPRGEGRQCLARHRCEKEGG